MTRILESSKFGERLSQAADLVYKLEIKNKALKEKLQKIKSQEFIEEQARNKLGLAQKGETVVVIPEDKLKLVMGASQSAEIKYPNWLGWLRVFWH